MVNLLLENYLIVRTRSQDTTVGRYYQQGGPWAQEDQGLLQGAGQEDHQPPDWLPGQASPQQQHLLLLQIVLFLWNVVV